MIGDLTRAEWREERTPSGRRLRRLTDGGSNSYPLYYFVRSETPDRRYFVFHSERSGKVQLYRLDLGTGEIGQLTDGHTTDSGWAIWCEWHLDGIYNHLSAIHPTTGEVFYFQDDEIRATDVASFANRSVAKLPAGRMPIGQAAFSPNGHWFGYIHADEAGYRALLTERERETLAGRFDWDRDHHDRFRNAIGSTLALVDTVSGETRTVVPADYHFHHVLFIDNETILVNHPRGVAGMWSVRLDGSDIRHLRPAGAPGAHGAAINHQVVTARGIAYEAVGPGSNRMRQTWFGLYHPQNDRWEEALLPIQGYAHVGYDPAGLFGFVENAGAHHEIVLVKPATEVGGPLGVEALHALRSPDHNDQRHHAHPALSSDRRTLFFTDWSPQRFAQICALDVADLVDMAEPAI
jgi:hypothetical protein